MAFTETKYLFMSDSDINQHTCTEKVFLQCAFACAGPSGIASTSSSHKLCTCTVSLSCAFACDNSGRATV